MVVTPQKMAKLVLRRGEQGQVWAEAGGGEHGGEGRGRAWAVGAMQRWSKHRGPTHFE